MDYGMDGKFHKNQLTISGGCIKLSLTRKLRKEVTVMMNNSKLRNSAYMLFVMNTVLFKITSADSGPSWNRMKA